jgi:hypothetical protein
MDLKKFFKRKGNPKKQSLNGKHFPKAYPINPVTQRKVVLPQETEDAKEDTNTILKKESAESNKVQDNVSYADLKGEAVGNTENKQVQENDANKDKDSLNSSIKVHKRKLIILMLENTLENVKHKGDILYIINKFKKENSQDYILTICYGESIFENRVVKVADFDTEWLFTPEVIKNKFVFYDALTFLEKKVNYWSYSLLDENTNKDEKNLISFSSIEIIGLGSGNDEGSEVTLEEAINSFCNVLDNEKVKIITKYICFSEENYIELAKIGFRSIATFPKSQ